MQSASYSLRVAAARQREFVGLYRLVLIAEALFGLLLLIVPRFVSRAFALADEADYRLWGAMLVFSVLLQLPGLVSPIHSRLTVIAAIAGRAFLVIIYLLLALWLPAVVAAVATAALFVLFRRLIYAEVGCKP